MLSRVSSILPSSSWLRLTDIVVEEECEQAHDHHYAGGCATGLCVHSRACCPDDVTDEHTDTAPSEQRTTTKSVHEEGSGQRCCKVEDPGDVSRSLSR
jgi:hypothetical protein